MQRRSLLIRAGLHASADHFRQDPGQAQDLQQKTINCYIRREKPPLPLQSMDPGIKSTGTCPGSNIHMVLAPLLPPSTHGAADTAKPHTESVLQTEIEEITAEEFGRSIDVAAQAAEGIAALKLPRSCKQRAKELASLLTASKRRWQETGTIPDEEDIKIIDPTNSTGSTSLAVTKRRRPATKRSRKRPSTKPVNLLAKTPLNPSIPSSQSQAPSPAGIPTTSNLFSWSETTVDKSSSAEPFRPSTANASLGPLIANPSEMNADDSTAGPHPNQLSVPTNPASPPASSALESAADSNALHPTSAANTSALPFEPTPADDHSSGKTSDRPLFQPLSPRTSDKASARNQQQSSWSHSPSTNAQQDANSSAAAAGRLTIIKCDNIRRHVFSIHEQFSGGSKPSWAKYQTTWQSLVPLLEYWARAMRPPVPAPPEFGLQRTSCSYGGWIDTITSLVRGLYRLLHPPQHSHKEWARIVAASVKMMADNLFKPPQLNSVEAEDHLTQGVEVLAYLDAVKNASSSFDPPQENAEPSSPFAQRSHSLDVIRKLRDVIIDVLMAYIILHTNYFSDAPLTPAQKKANTRANQNPRHGTTESPAAVQKAPLDLANVPKNAAHHLQMYQRKQNLQPFVYFVLAGVRGLFITSRDHRIAGISTCMSFIQAIAVIKKHTTTAHTPEELIWKNLSGGHH
ncbi:hypothetical protein PTTG_03259 [Puccinia triticina 1-1 BBBD Race 1]|uniref:Uncharacterized protein n=1 Tax=Puccinia triticina (isolate 1-1 / race 1 (BBBD)) TaxID=630390 RepID=A0A180GHS7_PUCT1|nr:hypothetical protein PTTG_03259 [Puccinia triticina 1-1 BBBD Race 1]